MAMSVQWCLLDPPEISLRRVRDCGHRKGLVGVTASGTGVVGPAPTSRLNERHITMTDQQGELPPRLLDITSLATHLGVNARHVRRLVAERRIPFIKWGHLIRFDPVEVREWIDAYRRHPGRPA